MVQPPEILFHYSINEIARICAVTLKTARNWKAGKVCPPATALMVLQRDLGVFHPAWSGWTVSKRGELCSPENWIVTPGDVLSIQFTQAQLSAWRIEAQSLREQVYELENRMDEQPTPDHWEIQTA